MDRIQKISMIMVFFLFLCNTMIVISEGVETRQVTLLEQGFENPFTEANWSNYPGWNVMETHFFTQGPVWGEPSHSGLYHAYSWAETQSMVTSSIHFGDNSTLSFWYAAEKTEAPMNLEVYVDGDLIWSDYDFNHKADTSLPDNGYLFVELTSELEPYAQGVHTIAFYNPGPSSSISGFMIDDVKITTIGEVSFDDAKSEGNDGGLPEGGGSGGGPPSLIEDSASNRHPFADLSAGEPYIGVVGQEIEFDGSESNDPIGDIVNWTWDFGDGSHGYGMIVSHVYLSIGNYTVTLTVRNETNETNSTSTIARIYQTFPPSKPNVKTPFGILSINTIYRFIATAEDPDGDDLKYVFDWGDSTETITDYFESGSIINVTHSYTDPGVYSVRVHVVNTQGVSSEKTINLVLVDADILPIEQEIDGYLIDYELNGIFDTFYNSETGVETAVERLDENVDGGAQQYIEYLIDIDGDGSWDYVYNTLTGLSVYYSTPEPDDELDESKDTPGFKLMVVLGVLIFFIGLKKIRFSR